MMLKSKYLKRFRHQSKRTDKAILQILGERDAAINHKSELHLNRDHDLKCRIQDLYQFMLNCHTILHQGATQRLLGLNKHQIRSFRRYHRLNLKSFLVSLKQIRKL